MKRSVNKGTKSSLIPGVLLLAALLFGGCGTDFELGLWTAEEQDGATGSATSFGRDTLDAVNGVAVSGDFLYVTDPFNDLVIKLDMTRSSPDDMVWEAGGTGSGVTELDDPAGIAIDEEDNLWVADSRNGRIQKLSSGGAFLASIGEGELDTPVGVAVKQGFVYVTDEVLHKVFKYSAIGVKVDEFGTGPGSAQGQLNSPAGVAVDIDGDVFVVNRGNFRVEVFSDSGGFLRSFGGNGTAAGMFRNPYGIAADAFRRVLVGDRNLNKIQRFEQNGTFVNALSTANPDGAILDPMGLATAGTFVYIAESGAHRIRKVPFSLFSK
ncbi:hypothetical protein EPN96_12565 [bacterium]|nr:MAG: hypothetical protein EPN96_12565 [bacterium]